MKKRFLRIVCLCLVFVFTFSVQAKSKELKDAVQPLVKILKAAYKGTNSEKVSVIEVTDSDTKLTSNSGSSSKNSKLTHGEEATAVASGLIASGKTKESDVKAALKDCGYTETEAEIAFKKAIAASAGSQTETLTVKPSQEVSENNTEFTKTCTKDEMKKLKEEADNGTVEVSYTGFQDQIDDKTEKFVTDVQSKANEIGQNGVNSKTVKDGKKVFAPIEQSQIHNLGTNNINNNQQQLEQDINKRNTDPTKI